MPLLLAFAGVLAIVFFMDKKTTSTAKSSPAAGKAGFFTQLRPVALAVERETGIKSDLGMTQAAHESAYGTSQLATSAYNIFGFTAEIGTYWRSQGRPIYSVKTREFKAGLAYELVRPFRAYASWEESYRDWARLMQTPAYAHALLALRAGNLKAFSSALQITGYATDPNYATKLEGVARAAGVA